MSTSSGDITNQSWKRWRMEPSRLPLLYECNQGRERGRESLCKFIKQIHASCNLYVSVNYCIIDTVIDCHGVVTLLAPLQPVDALLSPHIWATVTGLTSCVLSHIRWMDIRVMYLAAGETLIHPLICKLHILLLFEGQIEAKSTSAIKVILQIL